MQNSTAIDTIGADTPIFQYDDFKRSIHVVGNQWDGRNIDFPSCYMSLLMVSTTNLTWMHEKLMEFEKS